MSLELVKEVDLGQDTRTVTATDIFTSDYDVYWVTINDLTSGYSLTNFSSARFLNTSDTEITNSNYDYAYFNATTYTTPFGQDKNTGQDKLTNFTLADANPEAPEYSFYVFNPMSSSSYTFIALDMMHSNTVNQGFYNNGIAVLKETTQVAGMSFTHTFADQIFNGGTLRSYGFG